jgi:hypothetical protein
MGRNPLAKLKADDRKSSGKKRGRSSIPILKPPDSERDLVLVHRQVESTTSELTQYECIVQGDFAASCGEGLSHTAKVAMEGTRPT